VQLHTVEDDHECAKHCERLRSFRNFSDAFVSGITGSAVKRDALPFKTGAGK